MNKITALKLMTKFAHSNNACNNTCLQTINLLIGFEVLTPVVTNVAIFWDIAPCIPYVNQHFGGTYHAGFLLG
jgi:hypothetical protein